MACAGIQDRLALWKIDLQDRKGGEQVQSAQELRGWEHVRPLKNSGGNGQQPRLR